MDRAVADLEAALAAGGETGRLIAGMDWERSTLGPMRSWPERLKAAIAIAMRSTFAIHIAWGSELHQFYNDAYRPVLGSTKHPAIGVPLRETFPETFDAFILPRFAVALDAGRSYTTEDELFPLDRHGWLEESHFRFTYDPLGDDEGRIAGVLTICIEITQQVFDHRRLELLTRLDAISLAAQDGRAMRTQAIEALGATPDTPCAIVLDPHGAVVHAGGLATTPSHVGLSSTHLASLMDDAGRVHLSDLGLEARAHPSWPAAPFQAWVGWLDDHPLLLGLHPGLAFDHSYRNYIELVASSLHAAEQRLQRLVELNAHIASLGQLDELKEALLSDVSHELRTPLMLISGTIEELAGKWRDPVDLELLSTASRASERLRRLVDGLMVYGQLAGGHLAANLVPTDIGRAVGDCCDTFAKEVERSGIAFHVELPEAEATVALDGHLWQTVLYNLLANALRFTHSGSIRVRVTADSSETVEVSVIDTGVGIIPEEHPRLFDRFHRVHGQQGRTEEGAGLGLALVAEIVQRHHGTVTVDSTPGEGATFRIQLPRLDTAAFTSTSPASDSAVASAVQTIHTPGSADIPPPGDFLQLSTSARIVVAEDNDELRQMLTRALGTTWQVEAFRNGREAMDAIASRPVDLVVTDATMPVMDGFALIAELRADPATSSVPILLLTGRHHLAEAANADATLHKPFPLTGLIEAVSNLLSDSPSRAAPATRHHQVPQSGP